MGLSPGVRLGAYDIIAPLGAGGMGEVYRARDTRLGREVAIKGLPDAFAADPDRLMRFEREARTLASLNHQHIAQVYGLEQSGSTRALVMELVEGEDLSARIARGALPLDEALPVARQIAEALEAAHALGIVHRDLKPGNVKVRDDGTVKVLDFGLAKAVDRAVSATSSGGVPDSPTITSPALTLGGVILGTAAYMSPEQAKGRAVDKRADIWAFGCVCYEMLTGRRAFEGEDVSDTLAAILRSEPDWSALPPLPSALTLLLKRCLERDYRRRVGDIAAVRFVLEELSPLTSAAARDSDSVAASAGGQDPHDHNRDTAGAGAMTGRRTPLRVVAALAAVVVIAGSLTALSLARASRPTGLPVTRFVLSMPQGQVLTMSRRMATLSPDGQMLAYTAENRVHLRRFSRFDAESIPADDLGQQITSPTFSPDGAWIAFHSGSQNVIKRLSIRGGAALRVCDSPLPVTISWEASGILLGLGEEGIARCDPAGGAPQQLVRAAEGESIIAPQLIDDDLILLTVGSLAEPPSARWDRAQVAVQSLKTGERRTLISAGGDARVLPTGHLVYRYSGLLYAAPFDRETAQLTGEPLTVVEGVMRATTGPTQMATADGGTLVYIPGPTNTSSNERQLAAADRAGVVARLPLAPLAFVHVRVSADGKQLALASDDGADQAVWVYPLDGSSALRRLTLSGRNRFPVWSPDGQWIAYQSERDAARGIYRQRADGTGAPERLTTSPEGELHVPESWSPDGRHLVFSVQRSAPRAQYALFVLSLADRRASAFSEVTSLEPIGAVFSPDGKWLAYTRASRDDISAADRGVFVQPFPPTGTVYQVPRQLVDFHPVWSGDGRELIFLASTTAAQMAATEVTMSGGGLSFGTPRRFSTSVTGDKLSDSPRSFDILPDGRLIGMVGPGEGVRTGGFAELRVVMNWFEELVQRVPLK